MIKDSKELFAIVGYLRARKNQFVHIDEIKKMLNYDGNDAEIRVKIQIIRERWHQFIQPREKYYLLATSEGYSFSNNRIAIKAYKQKLQHCIKSKHLQLKEIELVLDI